MILVNLWWLNLWNHMHRQTAGEKGALLSLGSHQLQLGEEVFHWHVAPSLQACRTRNAMSFIPLSLTIILSHYWVVLTSLTIFVGNPKKKRQKPPQQKGRKSPEKKHLIFVSTTFSSFSNLGRHRGSVCSPSSLDVSTTRWRDVGPVEWPWRWGKFHGESFCNSNH